MTKKKYSYSKIRRLFDYKGFSLLEIVISLGVFMLIISTLSLTSLDALRGIKNNQTKTDAYFLIDEVSALLLSKKAQYWPEFVMITDAGEHHVLISGNQINILPGNITNGDVTHWFEVSSVLRDTNGNLVTEGGTNDPYSRRITLTLSWSDPLGLANQLIKEIIINDWNTARWTVTTLSQFSAGNYDLTTPVDHGDGAVGLTTLLYPDWCNPEITMTSYDIPGQGDARTVFANAGNAFFGTGGNASGTAFTHASISGVTNPTVTIEGQYDGNKVNDIYVDDSGDYAYLATDTNDAEVIIISLLQKPYVQIGSVDGAGPTNGTAVAQKGNYGYLAQGARISVFDLSVKTNLRPIVATITLDTGGTITDIDIVDNYAFVSISGGNRQVVVIDITNPIAPVQRGGITVNSYSANSVTVKDDGTRIYIGTASNSGNEFFIVDSTNKNGPWSIISAYDTQGMSITGLGLVDGYSFAILVGTGGIEYQVVRIIDEIAPVKCGQLDFAFSVHDIATVKDGEGNVFSYAVTAESSAEFRIIRGGPGGGWGNGYGFATNGEYTSSIFDAGSSDTVFYYISWLDIISPNTTLRLQVRSSDIADMSGAAWQGPDGTSGTYYTDPYGAVLHESLNFKRYIQFRAYFEGDSVNSPLLEEISISYQN